jgi:YbgC/YbaW family acyl-CoA thioester hydrolase
MPYEFTVTRRVEFSETDMAGIMHFSNFFRLMESAEHAFFRSLGFSVAPGGAGPEVGWPRVHAECHYHKPLRFEDLVEVRLLVAAKKSKAITCQFRFRKLNVEPPEVVARGSVTIVCVTHQPGAQMRARTIPRELGEKIDAAPAELLAAPHGEGHRR